MSTWMSLADRIPGTLGTSSSDHSNAHGWVNVKKNVFLRVSSDSGHSTTSYGGGGNNRAEVESMFGIARRFPSIRLNASAKKAKKKQDAAADNFPRDSGNNVSLTFAGSLDRLYSQPEKPPKAQGKKVTKKCFT